MYPEKIAIIYLLQTDTFVLHFLIKYIKSYLSEYNILKLKSLSEKRRVTSGVPQVLI